ncbi:MAG: cell division protein FtsA [Puniceicoccales bacterium]|jgi:cell division protein FtsA|nr:cell division protein FtsA [Puniceicoccales bacterium]
MAIITGIDVGTHSIKLITAEINNPSHPRILLLQKTPSHGVHKGIITDIAAFKQAISRATEKMEADLAKKGIKKPFRNLYASLSGSHLKANQSAGTILLNPQKKITKNDIRTVVKNARKNIVTPNEKIRIASLRQSFFIDGAMCPNPLERRGQKLQARYWHVFADEKHIKDIEQSVDQRGLKISFHIFSSLASASVLAERPLKTQGVVIVDIGAGSTDFAAYHKGSIFFTGSLPVGGNHISYDLCRALNIKRDRAESLKHASETTLAGEKPEIAETVEIVINARVNEIFRFIKSSLGEKDRDFFRAGIILTGGTSHLRNIEKIASHAIGLDIRKREFPQWVDENLRRPEYTTALGLIELGSDELLKRPPEPNIFRKIKKIFSFS